MFTGGPVSSFGSFPLQLSSNFPYFTSFVTGLAQLAIVTLVKDYDETSSSEDVLCKILSRVL